MALSKVLLVLDGLDECKTPLDLFQHCGLHYLKKEIQVDHLDHQHHPGQPLPRKCPVWITSVPARGGLGPGAWWTWMTEIRGFSEEEIKTCLEMFPEDPILTGWVLSQVQADPTLYLMCTVPAFCRLVGAALGHSAIRRGQPRTPSCGPR